MSFSKEYMIIEPFNLPWAHVSPANEQGLEYHLSPHLSILIDGIVSGEDKFLISHFLLQLDNIETNELEGEHIFRTEMLPAKSKERIKRAFDDDETTCFFSTRQMENLQKLFESKNFMSYEVKVVYGGTVVDDVVELPKSAFDLVIEAFEELHVQGTFDFKKHKEDLEEDYRKALETKVSSIEEKSQGNLWSRMKKKGLRKKLAMAMGCLTIGVAGFIGRRMIEPGGMRNTAFSVILGVIGIAAEMYGRNMMEDVIGEVSIGRAKGAFI